MGWYCPFDDDIPNWMQSHKSHVPNHQPVLYIYTGWWFQTCFFYNKWDNPPHWLIFFKMVKTTNQFMFLFFYCISTVFFFFFGKPIVVGWYFEAWTRSNNCKMGIDCDCGCVDLNSEDRKRLLCKGIGRGCCVCVRSFFLRRCWSTHFLALTVGSMYMRAPHIWYIWHIYIWYMI